MKAVTFEGKRFVQTRDVPEPQIQEPNDLIIQTRQTAICGSDLHIYLEHELGNDYGTIMGHEFLGEVVEIGRNVKKLKVGDIIVSPFTTNCGDCFFCQNGLTCRCIHSQLFGWMNNKKGLPGAQAAYVRLPFADASALKLPQHIDEESALRLGDVLATGFFCAEMAGVSQEGPYVVIGCGPVGLLAIIGVLELGATNILAIDMLPERLALAQSFGAKTINATKEDVKEIVMDTTHGLGADAVLEVVGTPQATRTAIEIVRPGGTIAAVGVHNENHFAFSPVEAYDKNLTYRTGRCPARIYMERLLPLVQDGKYNLSSIISHRMTFDEAPLAYELFEKKMDGCTKVILKP